MNSQKTTFIYGLWDPRNYQLRYIGKSDNPKLRLKQHIKNSKSKKSHLNYWIRQLLSENLEPSVEILDEVDFNNWEKYEQLWIHDCRKFGLNLVNATNGGEGAQGYHHDNATRKRIGERLKGRPSHRKGKKLPTEHIEKIKNAMQNYVGIPISEEVRKKIAEGNRGKVLSDETKRKVGLSSKGRNVGLKRSIETRKKMSEAQLGPKNHQYGKKLDEKHKDILRKANTGKKHSPESIRKMSEARKKYWENKKKDSDA